MRTRPFPRGGCPCDRAAMTDRPPRRPVHRMASVQLRGRTGPLATSVYWPDRGPAASRHEPSPALLVLLSSGDDTDGAEQQDALSRGLCSHLGVVVLSVPCPSRSPALEDAIVAANWSADHALELGADPGRVLVAGAA